MKLSKLTIPVLILTTIVYLPSCIQSGNESFETKADSLKFAKSYYDKYPAENFVITKFGISDSGDIPGSQPINWEEVLRFKEQYDKHPIIYNFKKQPLKGFGVDSAGYSLLQNNNEVKGLYLRLARRDNGNFTIMVLGTDSKGNVLEDRMAEQTARSKDSTKYGDLDHLETCPDICPPNFE